jgi:hypothetical protein
MAHLNSSWLPFCVLPLVFVSIKPKESKNSNNSQNNQYIKNQTNERKSVEDEVG